jgi:hypothetical protein
MNVAELLYSFVEDSLCENTFVWGGGEGELYLTVCDTTCSELRWCSWFICVAPQTVCIFSSKHT